MPPNVIDSSASGSNQVDISLNDILVDAKHAVSSSDDDDDVLFLGNFKPFNSLKDFSSDDLGHQALTRDHSPRKDSQIKWMSRVCYKRIAKAKINAARLKLSAVDKQGIARSNYRSKPQQLKVRPVQNSENEQQENQTTGVCDYDQEASASDNDNDSLAKDLLSYRFEPWTEVTELIQVHSGIYESIRFECNDFDQSV